MKGSRPIALLLIFLLLSQVLIPITGAKAYAQDAVILGSIPLDKEIDAIAIAPNTGIAYGINSGEKTLYIFDLKTYSIKKKIRLERKPNAIAVDPSSNIAYITASLFPYEEDDDHGDKDIDDKGGSNKNKGILYKADSGGNVSSIEIPRDPQGISINDQRHTAVIALEKDKKLLILSLDTLNAIKTVTLPHRPKLVSLDTDSDRAVVIAGKAKGEGRQNQVLIVDLNTGNILNEIELKNEIKDMAVDAGKDIAVALSEEKLTLIDLNTGNILSTIKTDDAEAADINQSTHAAVITGDKGILLLDLNTLHATPYTLHAESNAVAVDKYRNTALLAGEDRVIEIQLPNPKPVITNLIPKSSRAGEPGFNLKVEGEKFITTSAVQFNQNNLLTSFKDNKELEALVSPDLITMPGDVPVTVTNPLPDGGISEPYLFPIKSPTPVLQSISPDTIAARSPDFTLKVYGSNFMPGYTVNFNGQNIATTYINSGELSAIAPASLIAIKGIYLVVVITPDGQNSNFLNFTVTDPYPVITDFTPIQGYIGTLVTITGNNFNYTPTKVFFNPPYQGGTQGGVQATIQSLTQTEIRAIVPVGATTGPITVTTSIGTAQSALPFTVLLRQDFALNIKPQSIAIPVDGNASAVISLQNTGIESFTGLVKLSLTQPADTVITAIFNPEYISLNQSSIVNIKLLSSVSNQPLALTVSGTANVEGTNITRAASLILNPIPPGATTITGRIMRSKDAMPVKGVTLTIGGKTAVTDEAGNFFFIDVPVGEQILEIDGDTANTSSASYPSDIMVPVTIIGGVDNKLPYFIYLHEVNTKNFAVIDPAKDTILKDPDMPDFELTIPAGVRIIGHDGLPNEKISVTLVPIDRLPIRPPPEGVYATDIYMYYFFKPGGGTPDQPIPVKMPNNFQAEPGERITLWYYDESPTPDPNSNQWKPFGMGTVSDDGRNIIPDPGVGIPKFCCGGSYAMPRPATTNPAGGKQCTPPDSNIPCKNGCKGVGEPVDPYNGAFISANNDPGYSTVSITRLYKSDNTMIGQFGLGAGTNYDHFLQGTGNSLTYITPEAGRYILSKNPDGSYTNTQYPFLKGAKAYLNPENTRTLKFKDGTTYTFDTNARLIEQRDSNGNFVYITRDDNGYITGLTDNYGRKLYITNASIYISLTIYTVVSAITDEAGRKTAYAYDTYGRLLAVTDPEGGKTTYTYDTTGRILTVTNPMGIKELTNQYDTSGKITKQTQADSGEYLFYYFGPSTPVRVVDPPSTPGASCAPQFVREGEQAGANTCGIIYVNVPSSVPVPQGSTATTMITQTVVINPNKASTTYRFNSLGYPLAITNGQGGQTGYERQTSINRLLSVTDKLGRKTGYTYDSNGNITSITDPAGNITRYEYDLVFNKPVKITDALNNITTMAYDAKGNLIKAISPQQSAISFAYNSYGQPVSITDALGNTTTFEYDSYGNLIKATDTLGNSAQMAYDIIGRLIKATDPKGKSTSYVYDMMNRIKEVTDAINGKTIFAYDKNGNLLTVTDAKAHTITYTYTVRDKVSSMIDQLGRAETYSYDKMDNPVSVKDRKNQTTTYMYDMLNRLTKTVIPAPASAGVNSGGIQTTEYFYDAVSRLTYINDSMSGPISYAYSNTGCSACGSSAVDKIVQELTPLGMISYEYNALGWRTKATIAGQEPVYYGYDSVGRLISLTQGDKTITFTYDALGRRVSMTLPNGVTTNYTYDNSSRLLEIDHLNPVNAILEKINYSYDPNGNRISANRLNVPVKLPNPASNITYNSANQMLSFNDKTITYDANGNMETITNSCGTTNYTWDARNQLVGISGFDALCSPLSAAFKYDALGRRTEKTINGRTIKYLYDGLDIAQEIQAGMVTVNYLKTLNLKEPLAMINNDGVYYYIYDGLGSIIGLTDSSGQEVVQYYYDPFGNTTTNNPSFKNPFQYTGQENDGTGWYDFGFRYYFPELHRFPSEDPIGLLGGINKFSFVGNNPVNFVDPLGLDVAVQIGSPQGTNIFGHVAVAVSGRGVFSAGTKEPFGSSFTDYLRNQSAYRNSIIYVIPTSKEQDDAVVQAFEKAAKRGQSATKNNCADITGEGLKAAGLIKPNAMLKFPGTINSYMNLRADEGKVSVIITIQKGNDKWELVDKILNQFNPK